MGILCSLLKLIFSSAIMLNTCAKLPLVWLVEKLIDALLALGISPTSSARAKTKKRV